MSAMWFSHVILVLITWQALGASAVNGSGAEFASDGNIVRSNGDVADIWSEVADVEIASERQLVSGRGRQLKDCSKKKNQHKKECKKKKSPKKSPKSPKKSPKSEPKQELDTEDRKGANKSTPLPLWASVIFVAVVAVFCGSFIFCWCKRGSHGSSESDSSDGESEGEVEANTSAVDVIEDAMVCVGSETLSEDQCTKHHSSVELDADCEMEVETDAGAVSLTESEPISDAV